MLNVWVCQQSVSILWSVHRFRHFLLAWLVTQGLYQKYDTYARVSLPLRQNLEAHLSQWVAQVPPHQRDNLPAIANIGMGVYRYS